MPRDDYNTDENGYYRFNGSGRLVHRWVAEKYVVKRKLREDEIVHHKNGNKLDNRSSNLEVMTWKDHIQHHQNYRDRKLVTDIVTAPFKLLRAIFSSGRKRRHRKKRWI